MLLFIVYPGLTVQVFSLFKCVEIKVNEFVLEVDPGIQCYDEVWFGMSYAAYTFMIIYVLGIPLGTYIALRLHKNALWDKTDKYHVYYMSAFGNLYEPYLHKYYYWDVIDMMRKMIMTGGLILVATGSSAQLLLAEIITLSYMLFVLKLMPYHSHHDDLLSFVTSLQIMLTLMLAFALKTDTLDSENGSTSGSSSSKSTYDSRVMGLLMTGLTVSAIICMLFCFYLVMKNLIKDNFSNSKTLTKMGKCCKKCTKTLRDNLGKKKFTQKKSKSKSSKASVKPVNVGENKRGSRNKSNTNHGKKSRSSKAAGKGKNTRPRSGVSSYT